MDCLHCGHRNPATGAYCQRCGQKLDLTAEEIRETLVHREKQKSERDTEYNATMFLIFSIVLFVLSLTAFVATGGAPENTYFIPSCSANSDYVQVPNPIGRPVPPLLISREAK